MSHQGMHSLEKQDTGGKNKEHFPDHRDYFNNAKSRAENDYSLLQDIHVLAVQRRCQQKNKRAEVEGVERPIWYQGK